MKKIALIALIAMAFASCTKTTENERYLILKFKFDNTLPRLNKFGRDTGVLIGNAAQNPMFNYISSDYAELTSDSTTLLGKGDVLYTGSQYYKFGDTIPGTDFSKSIVVKEGEAFLTIPLRSITAGSYEFLRLSVAYQNFDVNFRMDTNIANFIDPITNVQIPGVNLHGNYTGTVASFIASKTFFDVGYTIKHNLTQRDSAMVLQGAWDFETNVGTGGISYPYYVLTQSQLSGDTTTTVVNPLYLINPIPKRSCIITAAFNGIKYSKDGGLTSSDKITKTPLVITGSETESIIIECQLSTNKSFEWRDDNGNGLWDPFKGEKVIDMGIRGMRPVFTK
jgi:hypothetical protein